ncbi:hypothetical protein M422DRAFT_40685 [Sphaerobolus stellatus SS14]|nr:hypothetical protein M422DRAFT_40685 [Sphaerobolus stellatus SS14]
MSTQTVCAVIWGISTRRGEIGFDPMIKVENFKPTIITRQPINRRTESEVCYQIHGCIFRFPKFFGRGTTCWRVKRIDDPDNNWYVVKDSWVDRSLLGREREGPICRHIKGKGVSLGVAQLVDYEEIRFGNQADSVLRNRKITSPSPQQAKLDLIHTRIFHCDISLNNILLNPGGKVGNRGILIDFDSAARIEENSEFAIKYVGGTYKFMSRNVLLRGTHTYLDDLESFYYVLRWILGVQTSAGLAQTSKGGQFALGSHTLLIETWFGQSLGNLADRLRIFFCERLNIIGQDLFKLNPETDYTAYISEIEKCISEMETE